MVTELYRFTESIKLTLVSANSLIGYNSNDQTADLTQAQLTDLKKIIELIVIELHAGKVIYCICDIVRHWGTNSQYWEQQGFPHYTGLHGLNKDQLSTEASEFAPSPLCLSLLPRRRHGMCDVISRAHTRHMLSPGFRGNQTTAVSSPAHVARRVQ